MLENIVADLQENSGASIEEKDHALGVAKHMRKEVAELRCLAQELEVDKV